MATLLEKANTWLDLVTEDVAEEIKDLPDANKLPTKEEALEILSGVDPTIVQDIVANVADSVETVEEAINVESVKNLVHNLKGLADPKVIMAVISLMGAFNTVDASVFTELFNKSTIEQTSPKSLLRDKIVEEFKKAPTASKGYAHVKVDGKDYFVGKGESSDFETAMDKAGENADEAAIKAGHESDTLINKAETSLNAVDEFEVEKDSGFEYYKVMSSRS